MTASEIFKISTPFIILIISALVIPLLKRGSELRKTFFELPAAVKTEAIDYILNYKETSQPMKTVSHKIKMEGYKLDKDVRFSRKVIEFYYQDRSKNARFCRNVLKARGVYSVNEAKIAFRPSMYLGLLIFSLAGAFQVWFGHKIYNPDAPGIVNAIPSYSLVAGGVVYACVLFYIIIQCIIIKVSKKRFNDFEENKVA